jgi:hypothetical protein
MRAVFSRIIVIICLFALVWHFITLLGGLDSLVIFIVSEIAYIGSRLKIKLRFYCVRLCFNHLKFNNYTVVSAIFIRLR